MEQRRAVERRDAAERRGGGRVRHEILSAAFCGITWTGGKWACRFVAAAILLAQAAVYGMTTDLQVAEAAAPAGDPYALVLVLAIIERKLLWPTISVLTAYLAAPTWKFAALASAAATALMSGGAEVQTAAGSAALTLRCYWGCCTLWRLPCGYRGL